MYSIRIEGDVARVRLGGLMELGEVDAYIGDLARAIVGAGLRARYRLIIDVSDCPIQPQATIARMGEHMARMPRATAIAIVTGSSLARMQIRRLFQQPYARIVATPALADDWVLRGIEPAQPALAHP